VEAPEWIVEELRRQDPLLSIRWNGKISRWQIHRQDPRRPNKPPAVVKTWCARDGSFLPLDSRLINWLKANDVQRRFAGRQPKYFGMLVDQELRAQEDADEKARQKALDDRMAEQTDILAFYFKKLDRRGLLTKHGGLR